MVAYLIILGDTLPTIIFNIVGSDSFASDRAFDIIFVATVIILPLSLLRDMSSLAFVSACSILVDITTVIMVAAAAPSEAAKQGIEPDADSYTFVRPTLFAGLGAMSFAFVCHHSAFIVYRSMANPTPRRWFRVLLIAIGASYVLCLCFGLVTYLSFLGETDGNVLNNFPKKHIVINIARGLLTSSMVKFVY